MIKKLLLTTALVIAGTVLLKAQCTPNASCLKGVCPDTTTNLPHAMFGLSYSTTMTVVVPLDTVTTYGTLPIDSVNYTSTTGLPTGFTVTPNKTGWPGGTTGCIQIAGTPADSMQGKTYKLIITTTIHSVYMSVPVSLPLVLNGYKIHVDSSNGVANFDINKFRLEQNSPNPFSKTTTIVFSSPNREIYNFTVLNVIGEKVFEKVISASIGENKIEFSASELPSGIYMYKLSNKEQVITKRMIVAGK